MTDKVLGQIAVALKIQNPVEWVATLKDGDDFLPEDVILEKIHETITERVSAAKAQSRKSGQAEQNAQIKRFVKAQGFENPDNLQGEELLNAYQVWKEESAPPPPIGEGVKLDELDKETLAKLPIVKSLIVEAQQGAGMKFKEIETRLEEKTREFEAYKRTEEEGKIRAVARQHFAKALKDGRVVLSPAGVEVDPEERIDAAFERFCAKKKIGLDAKGLPIMLREDGEVDADEFGNPILFSEAAVSIAKPMYGVSKQDPTHGGSGIQTSQQGGKASEYVPTMRFNNQQEKDAYVMSEPNPALRAEANRSWQHQQSKAAGT